MLTYRYSSGRRVAIETKENHLRMGSIFVADSIDGYACRLYVHKRSAAENIITIQGRYTRTMLVAKAKGKRTMKHGPRNPKVSALAEF